MTKVVCLSGGIGGAKLALGLSKLTAAKQLTVIANTGDDIELLGLRICPDVDTLLYTLSDRVNPETGWGLAGDTFHCLKQLSAYGWDAWFGLGDADFATHLWRTNMLRRGISLSDVTGRLARRLGVKPRVLPASEHFAPTMIVTAEGRRLHLQEYLVGLSCRPVVQEVTYSNVERTRPGKGVLDALANADCILIAPSNPLISIGPILAVPGIREVLTARRAKCIAVSPIVNGKALKGPLAKMMAELGMAVCPTTVARLYSDVVGCFVLDEADRDQLPKISEQGMRAVALPTVMRTLDDKIRLARGLLEICSPAEEPM